MIYLGVLQLVNKLNYQINTQHTFEVTAKFTDGVSASVAIIVNVLDTNDRCPTFENKLLAAQHTEPLVPGLLVAKTVVVDPDTVGKLTYSITGDNRFIVNNKGEITMNTRLETSSRMLFTTYNLDVTATDGRCSDNAKVIVTVNKIVVGSYLFPQPFYQRTISENQAVPFIVGQYINVEGHKATYSIERTNIYFNISETTGEYHFIF